MFFNFLKNKLVILFFILTMAAIFLSVWASQWPDGLESVAGRLGFEEKAVALLKSPLPDYVFPGAGQGGLATWLAAGAGVVIIFLVMQFLGILLGRKISRSESQS